MIWLSDFGFIVLIEEGLEMYYIFTYFSHINLLLSYHKASNFEIDASANNTKTEYESCRCGYRWVNYRRGKEQEKPKARCCAKFKNPLWDEPKINRQAVYLHYHLLWIDGQRRTGKFGNKYVVPTDICNRFLDIGPTIEKIERALKPFGDSLSPEWHQYGRTWAVKANDNAG